VGFYNPALIEGIKTKGFADFQDACEFRVPILSKYPVDTLAGHAGLLGEPPDPAMGFRDVTESKLEYRPVSVLQASVVGFP
jgi:hypothetical protein